MTRLKLNDLTEDVKRPIRNLAHRLRLKREFTNQELVEKFGPIVTYHGNRFDISHPRCNALIGGSIIKSSYEKMELQMIGEFVRPTDRVIELGACMGVTSLVLYDLVGRENHLVIEADRRNLAMAEHMFDLNDKDVRMTFGILASGDHIAEQTTFASNANPSSSSQYVRDGSETADTVPTIQFENILEEEQATALVLDIEGGEFDLFTHAKSFGLLKRIMLEAHPDILGAAKTAKMLAALNEHGFQIAESRHGGRFMILER